MISIVIALPAAFALRTMAAAPRRLLLFFCLLPALIPPAALGTGLLPLLYRTQLWGTMLGMVLVHVVLGLPVALLIIRVHLTARLAELETAAQGLGADRLTILMRITLPLV